MVPPIKITVPEGIMVIYLTALSLYDQQSEVSVTWLDDCATCGATFTGPSSSYVLSDDVFGQPVIVIDSNMPNELSVSFNFNDTMTTQHSVSKPDIRKVGPAGNGTSVEVSGFAAGDLAKKRPTTVTILMQGIMKGLRTVD